MKAILSIAALATSISAGIAIAHPAAIPHAHPHLHTVDGALLGFDVLTLAAVALFGVAIAVSSLLARVRRKK